ncbi:MAG: hypothetical protein ACI8WB_005640 [Phenylobacterium sp.]
MAHALNGKFKANQHVLEKDLNAAKALKQLKDIYNHQSPYGLLKNVSGLISQVDKVNQQLLDGKRVHALNKINGRINSIQTELDAMNATAELRNEALYGLQQQRSLVEQAISIAEIIAGQAESVTLETSAIEVINQYNESLRRKEALRLRQLTEAAEKAAKASEKSAAQADDVPQPKPEPQPEPMAPPPKPIQTIDPTLIQAASGYLETEDDIEQYIDALRLELQSAVTSGHRIRLESEN